MDQSKRPNHGLGIVTGPPSPARLSNLNDEIDTAAGAYRSGAEEYQTPDSARRLLTTPSTATFSGSTRNEQACNDLEDGRTPSLYSTKDYLSWLHSPSQKSLLPKDGTGHHDHGNEYTALDGHLCNSSKDFKQSMFQWPAIGILFLSLVSTTLSCLFFAVAAIAPKYGELIGTDKFLTVSTAAFLTSFLAKIIELSFVTTVVAYIGQKLTRKAYSGESSKAVSFAEISMRQWAVQPGTIISQWQAVRHAAISRLGALTLVATVAALLYTSAATALVQPQLRFSGAEFPVLHSQVHTSFANPKYMQDKCKTPIRAAVDPSEHRGISCFQMEQASQSYYNYQTWLAQWTDFALSGNGSRVQHNRLPGWALLSDNITVSAPWLGTQELHQVGEWMVNDVTLAVPHPGVVPAATDPTNEIMQPNELDGLGIYSIRAAVPSPFVNVLCTMGMSAEDVEPVMAGSASDTANGTGTKLDEIFQWGPSYGTKNWAPVFQVQHLPLQYNTMVNDTIGITAWGRDSLYVLGRGGDVDQDGSPVEDNFALCSLRVGQTAECSTMYNASSTGGHLAAICEDRHDKLRYKESAPEELIISSNETFSPDWVNVGSEWLKSIAMNDGSISGNSSNARIWTQLFLARTSIDGLGNPQLSNAMPSPAEALAVMSASTLLQSAQDAPFVQSEWNYSSNPLEPGATQYFKASVRAQQYASGGSAQYQKGFFVVLLATFLINVWILVYLLRHRYWYTDFVDPINLFPLAINSPGSVKLRESVCGGASWRSDHFKQHWKLQSEGGHVYMESPELGKEEISRSPRLKRKQAAKERFEMMTRPISGAFERIRSD